MPEDQLEVEVAPSSEIEVEIIEDPEAREPVPQEKLDELERESRARLETKVINTQTWKPEDRVALEDPAVLNRINVLTLQKNEALRRAESSSRQAEAAMQYAQAIKQQNEWLATQSTQVQQAWRDTAVRQKEAEIAQARNQYIEAHGLNDPAKMAEAQQQMAELAAQRQQIASWQAPVVQAAPPPPQFQQQPVGPSERALEWKARNPWFQGVGSSDPATVYALALSNHLISQGVVPDTEDYFTAIDREMQSRFGEVVTSKERTTQPQAKSPVVPPQRQAPNGQVSNKVRLTSAQVAVAKRMNVPLDVYAKQLRELGEA